MGGIPFPDGVELVSVPTLEIKPLPWERSRLRLRLRVIIGTMLTACLAIVVFTVFVFVAANTPLAANYATVARVTSQEPGHYKGDYCTLGLEFSFAGRNYTSTDVVGIGCKAGPTTDSTVRLLVNPEDPLDFVMIGHGDPRENRPGAGVFAFLWLLVLPLLPFILTVNSYRKARSLASSGVPWRGMAGTVKSRYVRGSSVTLTLVAEDTVGESCAFRLYLGRRGPWKPLPEPGETVTFAIMADGREPAFIATSANPTPHLVGLHVPNSFEIAANGL